MAILFTTIAGMFGGGAAAGTAAAGTAAAATTAGTGFSLSTILQGTATVLGLAASIGAGRAEADAMEAQAIDAEREKPIETLQGINRRQSIRRQMADAIGAQDVAYGASGVDLSFGTAREARSSAFREADTAIAADIGNEQTRISRLTERATSYRRAAKNARRMGFINGLLGVAQNGAQMVQRY